MKYFKVFNTESEYTEYVSSRSFISPNVSTLKDCTETWINPDSHDYSYDYFTIESLEDNNTITMTRHTSSNLSGGSYTVDISTDDGNTWTSVEVIRDDNPYTLVTLNANEKALFKYVSGEYASNNATAYTNFNSDGEYNVYGNIMSLVNADFAEDKSPRMFVGTFKGTKVVSAMNLVLPCEAMATHGYREMFQGCTLLVSAPELPAVTMEQDCYGAMFANCSSLVKAPSSIGTSATTLANSCYAGMFSGCTSLTTTPELPATTLADSCYSNMFRGCTALTTAKALPATTLVQRCYYEMFRTCPALVVAPDLPATTLPHQCYYAMFEYCSSLVTPPKISATTMVENSAQECRYMFLGCTSLTATPSLLATTLGANCYDGMFSGCTSLTTISSILPATTLAYQCYYNMFRECYALTTVPHNLLPATELASSCYNHMFDICTSLTTAPELPATTLADNCYRNMFGACTSLKAAPELPAPTLAESCYYQMFSSSAVIYIKCLATDISATDCTKQWTSRVPNNSGCTFVKSGAMNDWTRGVNGIPTEWTVYDEAFVEVTSVTLNSQSVTIDKGNTYTLTPTVLPSDATVKTVTWSTSDASVATVSDGVVTAVGCGNATITVTTNSGGLTAQCAVSVEKAVTGVDLNTSVLSLVSGNTYQLVEAVTPSDACDKSVTWSTSNSSIASVDTTGLVSGVTSGSATVTVTTVDGGFSKNCAITVVEGQHATGVTLSDASITINTNNTYTLTATVEPVDAMNKNVTWSSSDSTIASVDSSGVVSGVSSGSATITVTTVDGGYTDQCSVSVAETHDYSQDYFTIESLADSNTINIVKSNSPRNISLLYSTDNGTTWTDLAISATTNFTTINTGDKIIFKGSNGSLATAWNAYYRFNASKNFIAYGNAMSLLWGDNFTSNPEFRTGTTFNLCGLFQGTTTITDASNLILPASACTTSCYNGMFRGCTNLATAPELPAAESAQDCYSSMFEGCINLENAPEINLVNMSQACCSRMFCMNRSSQITTPKMTKSPILSCQTGANNCYNEMFKGNGNLVEVTCLMTSDFGCSNWLTNCSSTGTFKKASGVEWSRNTSGIPSGWAVEDYTQ